MDLISIVVAVYNAESTLEKCVDSLLAQTYDNTEIILVNDCSRDRSVELCEDYSSRFKNIITESNEKNSGPSVTRNRGIELASGKYICFIDSDDYVERDYLEKLYTYAEEYGTVPICGYVYHNEFEHFPPVNYGWSKPRELVSLGRAFELNSALYLTALWNKLLRLDVIKKHGIRFDSSLSIGEDLRFSLDYFETAKLSEVFVTSEALYHYTRLSGSTLMADFGLKDIDAAFENFRQIRNLAARFNPNAQIEYDAAINTAIDGFIYFIVRADKLSDKEKFERITKLRPGFTKKDFRKWKIGRLKEKLSGIVRR